MSVKYEQIARELCQEVDIPEDSAHEKIEQAFVKYLTRAVNNFHENFSDEEAASVKKNMRKICATYCDYNFARMQFKHGMVNEKHPADHEEGMRIKAKAKGMQHGVKTVMAEYLECSLDINLSLHRLNIRMADVLENPDRDPGKERVPFEHDEDMAQRIAFMRKKQEVLNHYREELKTVDDHLGKFEMIVVAVEKFLKEVVGDKKTASTLSLVLKALRQEDFEKAEKLFTEAADDKNKKLALRKKTKEKQEKSAMAVREASSLLVSYVRKNEKAMRRHGGGLLLRKSELRMLYKAIEEEDEKINAFLNRHEILELLCRKNILSDEKDRLHKTLSFERLKSLCDLLQDRLLSPVKTIGEARKFEAEVIEPLEVAFNDSRQFKAIAERAVKLGRNPDETTISDKDVWELPEFSLIA